MSKPFESPFLALAFGVLFLSACAMHKEQPLPPSPVIPAAQGISSAQAPGNRTRSGQGVASVPRQVICTLTSDSTNLYYGQKTQLHVSGLTGPITFQVAEGASSVDSQGVFEAAEVEGNNSVVASSPTGVCQVSIQVSRPRPGMLDPSFGGNGESLTVLSGARSIDVRAIAQRPDGSILVAGGSAGRDGESHLLLMSVDRSGAVNSRFGFKGSAFFPRPAQAYAVQATGSGDQERIYVAGEIRSGSGTDLFVSRFDPNGRMDPSFGNGGIASLRVGRDPQGHADAMGIESDGKIVVAGISGSSGVVARFTAEGMPDESFGRGGRTVLSGGVFQPISLKSLAIQQVNGDERILVAGSILKSRSGREFYVARLDSAGKLDPSFVSSGQEALGFGSVTDSEIESLKLLTDGSIVAGGFTREGESSSLSFALLHPDGSVDPTFGTRGHLRVSGGSNGPQAVSALAIEHLLVEAPDGSFAPEQRILFAGQAGSGMVVGRIRLDGTADPTFGASGVAAGPLGTTGTGALRASAVALQSDGRILVAGEGVSSSGAPGAAVLRYGF